MAIIKIENFFGEQPSTAPRSLGDAAAVSRNLYAGTPDFKPLPAGLSNIRSTVDPYNATITNPKSLYRFDHDAAGNLQSNYMAGWVVRAQNISYVKSQLNDAEHDRTYYTFDNNADISNRATVGAASPSAESPTFAVAPKVMANDGAGWLYDNILGVPAPTVAPRVTLSEVDEFSNEDATAAESTVTVQIADAMREAFVKNYYGNSIPIAAPNTSTIGWVNHGDPTVANLPSKDERYSNLLIPMPGNVVHPDFAYLMDSSFNGNSVMYAGNQYYAIAIRLYSPMWLPYDVAMTQHLTALKSPYDTSVALFDPAEVTSIVASSLSYWGYDVGSLTDPAKKFVADAMAKTKLIQQAIDASVVPSAAKTTTYTSALSTFFGTAAHPGSAMGAILDKANYYGTAGIPPVSATATKYYSNAAAFANLESQVRASTTAKGNGVEINTDILRNDLYEDFKLIINQRTGSWTQTVHGDEVTYYQYQDFLPGLVAALDELMVPFKNFFDPGNLSTFSEAPNTDRQKIAILQAAIKDAETSLKALQALDEELYYQIKTAATNAYNLGPAARIASKGVTRIKDTRYYIYTYVTNWGEESAPSPVSKMVEPDQNDLVWIEATPPPTDRNIVGWRVYRSVSGSSNSAFQLIYNLYGLTANVVQDGSGGFDYLNITLRNGDGFMYYQDAPKPNLDAAILGEVCPSMTWAEPPERLAGLVGMPNGIMAGFVDNYVAFCEPYVPYAWPVEYQVPIDHPIVGLGVFGQTLFVGTRANPYLISGSDSATMSAVKLPDNQACVARRSIASVSGGIMYASPDGLCLVNESGVKVISKGLWSREDWQKIVPSSIVAVEYEGMYVFTCDNGTKAFILGDGKLVSVDIEASAFFVDRVNDALYAASDTSVRRLFNGGARMTGVYKTGVITLPKQEPLAWVQVFSDATLSTPVTLKWYGDGTLRHTATITSINPQRLPPGRYLEHEIEVSSQANITSVILAGSTQELQSA